MLKKLILENWKSFRYAELPLDPLTILIGANASGKSNTIEALDFLHQFSQGNLLVDIVDGDSSSIRGGLSRINAGENASAFTLKILLSDSKSERSKDFEYSVTASSCFPYFVKSEAFFELDSSHDEQRRTMLFDSNRVEELRQTEISVLAKDFMKEHAEHLGSLGSSWLETLAVSYFGESFSEPAAQIFNCLAKINVFSPEPSQMRDYSALSRRLSRNAANIAGFLIALPEAKKTRVQDTITRHMSSFLSQDIHKIWAESVGRSHKDAMLYGEEKWGNGASSVEIDARNMSDGTLRFTAILTALLTCEEGSQLIVEDIDDGFHPSRTQLLLKAIKEIGGQRNIDVLVTTHNPALLDSLEQDYLPFVVVAHRDAHTGESLLTPLDKLENLPKLLASASLGDLVTQGAIERNLNKEAIAS